MGFVAIASVDADKQVAAALWLQLREAGEDVLLMETWAGLNGGSSARIIEQISTADVVLLFWSAHAESSVLMESYKAQAAREKKLLIVRLDGTPLPHGAQQAPSIDFQDFESRQLAIQAIRAKIATVRSALLDELWGTTFSPVLDGGSPMPSSARSESSTAPASLPDDWDAMSLDLDDSTLVKPPPSTADPLSTHDPDALSPPSARTPDFADTRADDSKEDVAFSRKSPTSLPPLAPTLLERLKSLGAKALDRLSGATARSAPTVPPTDVASPVLLAASAPRACAAGTAFTAALVAYVAASREPAIRKLAELGEAGDRRVLDVGASTWAVGAPVCVRVCAAGATVFPSEVSFDWNGNESLAAFSVTPDAASHGHLQLGFQVLVADVMVSYIPMQVGIGQGDVGEAVAKAEVPRTAFASYSSRDAESVTQRLSTLTRWTRGLDIFQDCLDLNPGEDFKPQLAKQIAARDVFLLFWSRQAAQSQWVKWEYTTALDSKGVAAILPMPLEDPAIAPPPPEFADVHLRDRFMLAGYALAKVREEAARN